MLVYSANYYAFFAFFKSQNCINGEVGLPVGDEGAENVPRLMEAGEVDLAVLLPLVPLPMDFVPIVERFVGCLLPLEEAPAGVLHLDLHHDGRIWSSKPSPTSAAET